MFGQFLTQPTTLVQQKSWNIQSYHKYVMSCDNWVLRHLGTRALKAIYSEDSYIVFFLIWSPVKVLVSYCKILQDLCSPVKVIILCIVAKSMYLCSLKVFSQYYATLYSSSIGLSVNMCLHSSLYHKDKLEKWILQIKSLINV